MVIFLQVVRQKCYQDNLKQNVNSATSKIAQEGPPPKIMQTIFITNHPESRLIKENGEWEENTKVRENCYFPRFSCYLQTLVE